MILILLLILVNFAFSQNPDEIVRKSIAVVEENDKRIETVSGEFDLKVAINYDLTVKKGNYEFIYAVKFENGFIKERKLVKVPEKVDSTTLMIAKQIERRRQSDSLKIKTLVFPFLRLRGNISERKVDYKFIGFDKINDKTCFLIGVSYKIKSDTAESEGQGKIWIDERSYVPLRCEYDVTYETKRFGRTQNKQFLDVSKIEDLFFPARNEVQVFPKVLFIKFGTIKVVYEANNFKIKNKLGEAP